MTHAQRTALTNIHLTVRSNLPKAFSDAVRLVARSRPYADTVPEAPRTMMTCSHSPLPFPLPGRPFYVNSDGGKLYICVHDVFHLRKQREFKRVIRPPRP